MAKPSLIIVAEPSLIWPYAISDLDLVNTATDSELPVLDPKVFDQTAAFFTAEMVASFLEEIVTFGETLLLGLRGLNGLACGNALIEMVHRLAGSASLFGFERVASFSRSFELAVETGTDNVTSLADELCAAIEATCSRIRKPDQELQTGHLMRSSGILA